MPPGVASDEGSTHYELTMSSRDPRAGEQAVSLLCQAADQFGAGLRRAPRTLLAQARRGARAGRDVDTAVVAGHSSDGHKDDYDHTKTKDVKDTR